MLLIAAKDDHITGRQLVCLTRNHEFDPSRLASQIFSRPHPVGHTAHVRTGWQLHPVQLEALKVIGQELAYDHTPATLPGNRISPVEFRDCFWRTDQLFHWNLKRCRDFGEHAYRRVRRARLEIGPCGSWHS